LLTNNIAICQNMLSKIFLLHLSSCSILNARNSLIVS
jgi:hypothetical protein